MPAWLCSPSRELCTEAEHEPVDNLVREILVASSAGAHCTFVTEGAGLGQREKSAIFSKKSDPKSKRMNLFKCFSDSVDIIGAKSGIATQTGRMGSISTRFRQSAIATAGFWAGRRSCRTQTAAALMTYAINRFAFLPNADANGSASRHQQSERRTSRMSIFGLAIAGIIAPRWGKQ
jgi:hypothetical protein